MMKLSLTERGFALIELVDSYDEPCSLQESSNVDPRLWFGCDKNRPDDRSPRMHLSRAQVENLLPYLQRFVDEGELFSDEEKALAGTGEAIADEN